MLITIEVKPIIKHPTTKEIMEFTSIPSIDGSWKILNGLDL